ncbi:MAG: alpha/beta fold hydrolase [Planctomycetes bacterium]|nr:alpha/beta fold hydrolase [Planctomycetota bacterium]
MGPLQAGTVELRIVFNISSRPGGVYSATMDSPDQGASGIPVSLVTFEGGKLRLDVKAAQAVYEGVLRPDGNTIVGQWRQSGMSFQLELKRTTKTIITPKRPQEPKKPYPYLEKEVAFENAAAKITLAGTLTQPDGNGPFPAVILITGSGPQDRDETVFGHKPFWVLADYLTRRGIAVLRMDDRGVGGSTGDITQATSQDFARDVRSGIEYLKSVPEINAKQIGLLGHSEGGIIAPMVAVETSDVAFIVMLAGTGINGEELLYLQGSLINKASGATPEMIEINRKIQQAMFTVTKQEKDNLIAQEKMKQALSDLIATLPAPQKKALEPLLQAQEAQFQAVLNPWFRFFLTYEPKPTLSRVKCPVLALNGEKDLQVPPKENLKAIEEAMLEGGNKSFTVKELPNLNHLFQTCQTGAPLEYSKIEETIAPAALKIVGD